MKGFFLNPPCKSLLKLLSLILFKNGVRVPDQKEENPDERQDNPFHGLFSRVIGDRPHT
jgi:hypothetical protein